MLEQRRQGVAPPEPTDEEWLRELRSEIRPAEKFVTGNLHRFLPVWEKYIATMPAADQQRPVVKRVLRTLRRGLKFDFVNPRCDTQRSHPRYKRNIKRVARSLARAMGPDQVEPLLNRTTPGRVHLPNLPSYHKNLDFVLEQRDAMLMDGRLVEWWWPDNQPPQCILPLGVDVKAVSGKCRLIHDAGYINLFSRYIKFSLESMEDATTGTTTGFWGVASDIKGGYTHLCFAHSSVTYTGVEIEGKVYAHVAVNFGNAPAPRVYTEVIAVMFHCMRMAGVYMTLYIDDRLMRAFLRHQLMQDALMAFILEAALGWAVSTEKLQVPPRQTVTWTGHEIHWHAQEPFLKIPEEKMAHVVNLTRELSARPQATPRELAQVAGKLYSMEKAVPLLPLLCRDLWEETAGTKAWDMPSPLQPRLSAYLRFLADHCAKHNGKRIWQRQQGLIVCGDASAIGFGARVVNPYGNFEGDPDTWAVPSHEQLQRWGTPVFQTAFTEALRKAAEDQSYSSTERELDCLLAFLRIALIWMPQLLRHSAMLYLTDSQNTETDIRRMRGGPRVFHTVCEIWQVCLLHDIDLQIKWLPREHALMQCADDESKEEDPSQWALSPWHTELIQQRWAVANIAFEQKQILDVFGDEVTAKSEHFFSRALCPGTSGIDGFTQAWFTSAVPKPLCWVNGPFTHMTRIIQKLIDERTDAVLIFPDWVAGWRAMLSELPVRDAFTLPKQDAGGTNQLLFKPGSRVPRKAREAGLKSQPNYEVVAMLIIWDNSDWITTWREAR
eukprot:jgi/Tetstr1/444333/TSEL_032224.t1